MEIKHTLIVTLFIIAFIYFLDVLWDEFKHQQRNKIEPPTAVSQQEAKRREQRIETFKKAHYECHNGYLYIVIGDKKTKMSSTIRNTCNEELMNATKSKTARKGDR